MLASIAKPIHRSALRLALGKAWYINKRRLGWYLSAARYARARDPQSLPHVHADHKTPMLREFAGVDLQLQRNKMASLKIACACIDGLIIKPGETVELKPGGLHLMYMDLRERPLIGRTVRTTLMFEKAGKVDVDIPVMAQPPGGAKAHHH